MASLIPLLLYIFVSNKFIILTWDILWTPSAPISLSFIFDSNGLTLIVTVLFIASNVLFFSATYISQDKFISRFISLVISFVIAICLLVILPNLLTLLIGWDGLGLSSYLLVLYYQTPKSQGAAIITAITNRLGDILILFTIAWSINTHWLPLLPWSSPRHFLIATILIVAAITKRAQYPFISWLPAAIAAPTPVSALVHSSTLVTAGVFILVRFYETLKHQHSLEFILLFSACITTLIAGLSALSECDIKKIIALSTLSQLGTMIFSLAINVPQITFFHLITHALFKALLFMTAGILIHFHHHSQDLRIYGSLNSSYPFISSILIISNFALIGIPFIAGFYSKDLIIETLVSTPLSYIIILLFIFATSLTSIYTIRFLINVTWSPRNTPPASSFQPSINFLSLLPLFNLSQATLIIGPILAWLMITPLPERTLPLILKLQALFAMALGITSGIFISHPLKLKSLLLSLPLLNESLTSIAFATPINRQIIARFPTFLGQVSQKSLEGGWIEIFGGQGVISLFRPVSSLTATYTGKSLSINIIIIFIFLFTLLIFILFKDSLNKSITLKMWVWVLTLFIHQIFLETALFLGTCISLLASILQRSHILIIILRLEATSLTLALLFSSLFSVFSEDYIGIIILTFAAAETASALALLATLTRLIGSDLISSCSFSLIINSAPKAGYHWWW